MQGTFKGSANLGTGEEIRIFSRILTLLAYSIESEQINEPYSSIFVVQVIMLNIQMHLKNFKFTLYGIRSIEIKRLKRVAL